MKKVSVFLITYNHEKYIGQAIESIISQETDFDFEIVIGEDCSKDGTRAICEQYAAKYPNRIKLLPSDRNYGAMGNGRRTLEACTGEYVAMCEGDDYWTDKLKLQKQINFLDAHPDYVMCFTGVQIVDELGWDLPDERYYLRPHKDTYTIEDFILTLISVIPTATLVFRNQMPNPLPAFWDQASGGDLIIHLLMGAKGKTKYLDEKTAVYRNHEGGITKSERMQLEENREPLLKKTFQRINEYLGFKYDKVFKQRFFEMSKIELIYGARNKKGVNKFRHYFKVMPKYIKYADRLNPKELLYYHGVLFFPSLLKRLGKSKN